MNSFFLRAPDEGGKRRDERRGGGRMLQTGVVSNLGVVVDISAGGMRVLASRRYHGERKIRLLHTDGELRLKATVVWTRRLGLWRHEVGLRFINLDAATAAKLTVIGCTHGLRDAL